MSRPAPAGAPAYPRRVGEARWQVSRQAALAGMLGGAVAAGWVGVALRGPVTVGHLVIPPLAAAAACGMALLASTLPDLGRPEGQIALVLLAGAPVTVAMAAAGRGSLDPLLVLMAAVAGVGLWVGPDEWLPISRLAAGAGAVLWLVAHTLQDGGRLHVDGRPTAAALLAAAALLIGAATSHVAPGSSRLLLVPGLLAGLIAAPVIPVAGAVVASAVAVFAAWTRRPVAAMALLSVAAASLPAGLPAARLLAAGAVLAAAIGGDVVVAVGLPGAVALSAVLVRSPASAPAVITALAAMAVVALFADRLRGHLALDPATIPAAAVAGWLLVAPGSWAWTGPSRLAAYDQGAARALAVALAVLVAAELLRSKELASLRFGPVPPSASGPASLPPRWARPAGWAMIALLLGSVGWLLLSAIALR